MKNLIALVLIALAPFAMAGGYGYGDKLNQEQSANAAAIAAAAASNKTTVDVTSTNHNHVNATGGKGGDATAYGGKGGTAASGSVSGSSSGGNKISNVIEGDVQAASSAVAGMASECVTVLAAQATAGGFSFGGIDGDCRAAIATDRNLDLYKQFKDSDPELAEHYLDQAKKYAELANPSAFKIYMSGTRQTVTDIVLSLGWIALFAL